MTSVTLIRTARIAVLILGILYTVASLQPQRPMLVRRGSYHSVIHIIGFMMLCSLACISLQPKANTIAPALATAVFGATIELAQSTLYRRPLEWDDIWLDLTGVAVAGISFALLHLRKRLQAPPATDSLRS